MLFRRYETEKVKFLMYFVLLKLMKDELHLYFKSMSSWPIGDDKKRIDLLRKVFYLEYDNLIEPESMIVNIEEATYSRTTWINYSWGVEKIESLSPASL